MGMQGPWGRDKMEECLWVNGRQLFVQVKCNLEEWEHVLLVQYFNTDSYFIADHVITKMD